jgi:hypothetical protein
VTRSLALPFALASLVLGARAARADGPPERRREDDLEHRLVLGIGGAAEAELRDHTAHAGGNVMLEWDAIEEWLELEVGLSVLTTPGGLELPVDLLVKKPFTLARGVEVMAGLGPEIVQVTGGAERGTYFGGELALDFMFWPTRKVGLWVEPEYDFVFHDGLSRGLGSTGGLLLGW